MLVEVGDVWVLAGEVVSVVSTELAGTFPTVIQLRSGGGVFAKLSADEAAAIINRCLEADRGRE